MFPEYPSQAAIVAGVCMGIFDAVFGPNPATPIVATDVMDPKLQRRFANVKLVSDEVQNVRVRHPFPYLAGGWLRHGPEDRRLPGQELAQAVGLSHAPWFWSTRRRGRRPTGLACMPIRALSRGSGGRSIDRRSRYQVRQGAGDAGPIWGGLIAKAFEVDLACMS
jgi:hypothetical protein